jgi:hypothetical protein
MRWCVDMMQEPFLLLPKFGAKSLHMFMQSPLTSTVVCRIDCLACQDIFFNNPLIVTYLIYFGLCVWTSLLRGGLICVGVITINPALTISDNPGQECCIVGSNLMKVLVDVDTLLLLICQKSNQARYTTTNERM